VSYLGIIFVWPQVIPTIPEAMGRSWEGHGKVMGRSWEGHGKVMGRSWEGHECDINKNRSRGRWKEIR